MSQYNSSPRFMWAKRWIQGIRKKLGIIGAFTVMFAALSLLSPVFLTSKNLLTVLRTVSIDAIAAYGMTFVILCGGIDLSVGSVVAFSSVMCAKFMAHWGVSTVFAILMTLMLGALVGALNGAIITRMKMLPFITTLGTSYIFRGFTHLMTDSKAIMISDEAFYRLGTGYLGAIPYTLIYMVVLLIALSVVLYKTRLGRRLYAIGGNEVTARFSGIKVENTRLIAYVIMGILSGLVGVIQCSRLLGGQPTIGQSAEMDAIAATILGGTSFSGGIGTLSGTFIGALVLGIMNNGLNLIGVASYWQYVARGVIIIIAVFFDVVRNSRIGKLKKN